MATKSASDYYDIGPVTVREDIKQCQTLFYQGILCSQTQIAKYCGGYEVALTNGQYARCEGRNNLSPIDVLIDPFIGEEIQDVNPAPFQSIASYLNPLNVISATIARAINWYHGINVNDGEIKTTDPSNLQTHALNISKISIGQETDIKSHLEKYKRWREKFNDGNLILYGVSRGAATTFNAFSRYQYPEVRLVVLEGCFYEFKDVLNNWFGESASSLLNTGLSLFTKYRTDGPSPKTSIENFPENVPVVFITSQIDKVVPPTSVEKLANELNARGQNDVYLLKLKNSSHPNFMFDDQQDRDNYEAFINAIYERYGLPCRSHLAEKGRPLLDTCLLVKGNVAEQEQFFQASQAGLY